VWSNGATGAEIEVTPTGTTTYTVTGVLNGCEATDEVMVIVEQIIFLASAGEDQSICQGYEATLTASEGDSYVWSTGETTQSITVSPNSTQNYTVTVFEGDQQAQDDVTVFVNLNPTVVIANGGEVSILEGEFITLSASGANTYEWSNGATQPNIAVNPSASTTYSVAGYINNCSDVKSVTVNVVETVEAYAGEDLTICSQDAITLVATGGDEYLWSTGETTQSITVEPDEDTEYSVLVYNELDSDEDSVMVFVNDCSPDPGIEDPQAFDLLVYQEPASDVIKVKISGVQTVNVNGISIYDLAGKLLYNEQVDDSGVDVLEKEINTSQFSRGIYIVRLMYDDKSIVKKIPIR
ncbi:T9SS type A sorting domain-containing protein, partial [uncultured Psychroserpens sp.]|uniref:T9SS type A sorting domain-containing protein n=1 Tax=uncultured Psychroserpens sp. TaxID=255436 RepID=UPI0026074C4A